MLTHKPAGGNYLSVLSSSSKNNLCSCGGTPLRGAGEYLPQEDSWAAVWPWVPPDPTNAFWRGQDPPSLCPQVPQQQDSELSPSTAKGITNSKVSQTGLCGRERIFWNILKKGSASLSPHLLLLQWLKWKETMADPPNCTRCLLQPLHFSWKERGGAEGKKKIEMMNTYQQYDTVIYSKK